MSQIATDTRTRGIQLRQVRRELDPEAFQADEQARLDDANHRNEFMERSDKPIWIHSTDPSAKTKMFCIFPYYAATYLVSGSHRLASDEEIAAHKQETARQQAIAKRIAEEQVSPGREHTAAAIDKLGAVVATAVTSALQAGRGSKAAN